MGCFDIGWETVICGCYSHPFFTAAARTQGATWAEAVDGAFQISARSQGRRVLCI